MNVQERTGTHGDAWERRIVSDKISRERPINAQTSHWVRYSS